MSPGNVRLRFRELRIPFKVAFKHAAAERTETETAWVDAVAADGTVGSGESCPRPYVTGETLASARAFVTAHEVGVGDEISDVASLRAWIAAHEEEIDANPAAWCAIELAILDLLGKRARVPLEALLSLPPVAGAFRYSAVLGDASPAEFHAMAERYRRLGFRDFKVKLSGLGDRDREKLAVFETWEADPPRVRADANNLWRGADEAIAGLRALSYEFFAIEEPIQKNQPGELSRIAAALGCPIILDESCARREQVDRLSEPASQWLINVRVASA
jgi:L-alanine-DL-glutamate epimerase-like enolase superfamily enzyme